MTNFSRIDFHIWEGGPLIASTRDAICIPRNGEFIEIDEEMWEVMVTTWSLKTPSKPGGSPYLCAVVHLKRSIH